MTALPIAIAKKAENVTNAGSLKKPMSIDA